MKRRLSTRIARRKILQHEEAALHSFHMERYKAGRFWGVYDNVDNASKLVCVCVYKKGATEVMGRLGLAATVRGGQRCQAR